MSLILVGLGVFSIAAGFLLRFYAYPALAKIPQDPKVKSVAQGSGVTALVYVEKPGQPTVPEIRRNLNLTSTTTVRGDLHAPESKPNGEIVSWVETNKVMVDQTNITVNAANRQLCLNRFSGEAVAPCTNGYWQKETNKRIQAPPDAPQFPGLNFKFPFDTQKQTYQWFDTSLGRSIDANFEAEEEISGLTAYRFRQTAPATNIDNRDVPGSLVNMQGVPTVKAGLYYEVDRTLWIEPATGAVLKAKQWSKQELRAPDQLAGQGTVVFDGTMELNAESVEKNVQTAKDNQSQLWLLTGLPVILWIAGGVLLAAGIVLLLVFQRRTASRHSSF